MPGYSGTPLHKKLGIKPDMTIAAVAAPEEYLEWVGELPAGARVISRVGKTPLAIHLFVKKRAILLKQLTRYRGVLEQTGFVWVSWPKKSSKVETDITEDVIREVALPLDFVDVKVCAVSEVWSGLKLMIRKSARSD